ncbi:MAG: hypothetical protein QOJ54_3607 [Aliidongia sp.]|jgi:hypothetical protein|nr:hypothetical protein [Aliidongia sp.]
MYKRVALAIIVILNLSSEVYADTWNGQEITAFTGSNIYAPFVMFDQQSNVYKMWYGGWQTLGQVNDDIYYKTSTDGVTWGSSFTTVMSPTIFNQALASAGVSSPGNVVHTNNPTITKFLNLANNTFQYTMFFTIGLSTGTFPSQIWSMVSGDGINWSLPVPFNPGSNFAPDTSSAVYVVQSNGQPQPGDPASTVWHLYFENDMNLNHLYMSYIDGNRKIVQNTTPIVVYNSPNQGIFNPNVVKIGNTWNLFFNSFNSYTTPVENFFNTLDEYEVISNTNTSWSATQVQELTFAKDNSPSLGGICAIVAPSVLPLSTTSYRMYFGQVNFQPNTECDLTKNNQIDEWTWTNAQ